MTTASKSARKCFVLHKATDSERQVLTVRLLVNGKKFLYTVTAVYDGFGLAVDWDHVTQGDRSYLCVVSHKGQSISCDCPARSKCKHQLATEALVRGGYLRID